MSSILFGSVEIETLLSIERKFFGRVRKMMRSIAILIQRNALFQVPGSDTLLDVGAGVLPMGD